MEKDLIVNINEDINLTVESPSVSNLSIEQTPNIYLEVSSAPVLNLTLGESDSPVDIGMDMAVVVGGGGVPYTGEYTVTPKAHEETVLPTKRKLMLNDVTVLEVPYYETSNEHGTTVYIAREV